ncbi:hypothetical protein C8A03DRAFT_29586 [Achaetomium macrosporum]|uniref:Uncharacterized protein n=1 Tax=Achaetomium macrosporum TaxID=79813 RepID=A0AAN7HEI1_9PEZI|nr:hypothetical protein C8A03DRAFT_29586 [Achaetomium macrosporum]
MSLRVILHEGPDAVELVDSQLKTVRAELSLDPLLDRREIQQLEQKKLRARAHLALATDATRYEAMDHLFSEDSVRVVEPAESRKDQNGRYVVTFKFTQLEVTSTGHFKLNIGAYYVHAKSGLLLGIAYDDSRAFRVHRNDGLCDCGQAQCQPSSLDKTPSLVSLPPSPCLDPDPDNGATPQNTGYRVDREPQARRRHATSLIQSGWQRLRRGRDA